MRVGLDVTPAVTAKAGLARYTEQLWRELVRRDDVEVHAFALGRGPDGDFGLPLTRRHLPLNALRPVWRAVRWPRAETFAGDVDVVHTIALTPIPTRKPQVVTIHDMLPITHGELYPPGAGDGQRAELAEARRARVIVTTCEATADEIVRVAGLPRERIVIARPGVLPPQGEAPIPVEAAVHPRGRTGHAPQGVRRDRGGFGPARRGVPSGPARRPRLVALRGDPEPDRRSRRASARAAARPGRRRHARLSLPRRDDRLPREPRRGLRDDVPRGDGVRRSGGGHRPAVRPGALRRNGRARPGRRRRGDGRRVARPARRRAAPPGARRGSSQARRGVQLGADGRARSSTPIGSRSLHEDAARPARAAASRRRRLGPVRVGADPRPARARRRPARARRAAGLGDSRRSA